MRPGWYLRWRLLALSADTVFIAAALILLTAWRFGPGAVAPGFVPAPGRDFGRAPLLFAIPAWLVVFATLRLYSPQRCENGLEEARRLVIASPAAAVAIVMLGFLVKENPARSWLVGAMAVGTLGAAMSRQTLRRLVTRLRLKGRWMTPTVVIGRRQAKAVVEAVTADRTTGIVPVATCGFEWPGVQCFAADNVTDAVRSTRAGQLIVVAEDLERNEIARALEVADELPVQVVVLPGLDHLLLNSLQLIAVGHEPGLALESRALHTNQAILKRIIDVTVGASLLFLTAPLMSLIALAVRLGSPGPILFRQEREGRGGKVFDTLKFRTMRVDGVGADLEVAAGELGFLSKPADDDRVTPIGRVLRKASLDELPQLWNVVRGDMSLVGPRPLRLWEARQLGLRRRLIVRPGITGLWQVSGRSTLSPEERIRLDLVYVQNWSLLLDLSILLRTVPAVIGGRGAY